MSDVDKSKEAGQSQIDKRLPVLVVEDDHNLRRIIVNILKKLNFNNIREAENGQNAWAIVLNTDLNLVITDLNMPIMDGLQLSRMIRGNKKYRHLPILVITAADTKETIMRAGKIGVDGYIIKPFNIKQIIQSIEEVFDRSKARNEAYQN